MIGMSSAYQVLNSPVVTVAIGVVLTACVAAATAVIGLFVKVSSMETKVKAISTDVTQLVSDKDIMRWSQWGPMEHMPRSSENNRSE